VKQEVERKLKNDSVSSRLNSIPDNKQMEIASETQEEFSFGNSKGEIVALFKPTVHYSDPA
jgi:alpha-acetolactate decarboxylase